MYLDINTLLWLTLLGFVGYFFYLALRTKEVANRAAEQYCNSMQVQFLDQTVFLKSWRLRRNEKGSLGFWREYQFEFTANGEDRYFGHVLMQGNRIERINLDAHRMH